MAHTISGSTVGHGTGKSAEAAVGARYDPLPTHHSGVALNPLSHQLWVLNEVGGGVDDSWDDDLVLRQLNILENGPLVLVPRVSSLEGDGLRSGPQGHRQHAAQGDIPVVGALVVAPAEMHAHPVRRNVTSCVIQGLQAGVGGAEEFLVAGVRETHVSSHG